MGLPQVLWAQWELLAQRLATAAQEPHYQKRWTGASGTVIMRSVFTEARFKDGCKEFLYLFQMMATKTRNEAVVEGMGSVWDKVRHRALHISPRCALTTRSPPCALTTLRDSRALHTRSRLRSPRSAIATLCARAPQVNDPQRHPGFVTGAEEAMS